MQIAEKHFFLYVFGMRIAQIAPIIERVPPKRYGGTERVVHALTEELMRRGHDVTLFASGDSKTSALLKSIYPKSIREARVRDIYGSNIWTLLNIGNAYQMQKDFDIIHDHNAYLSVATANLSQTPVVMTLHGPLTPEARQIFSTLRKPYLITISKSQSQTAPNLNYIGTVYNGLNMEIYPFSETHDGYLLFVGRISIEKGVHIAIEAAQILDMPLIIAAKLDAIDKPYFHEYVEPWLSRQIRWIGEVNEQTRNRLMSKAAALLHPATWREPFGLTLVEAMACGCPVLAFNRGSAPEIIQNGKTGFVVQDLDEMLMAFDNLGTIDRAYCRRYALGNFNAQKMADGYEKIYQKILGFGAEQANMQMVDKNI